MTTTRTEGGCGVDGLEGLDTVDADKAMRSALDAVRAADRGGAPDPIDDFLDRIVVEKRPELAMDPLMIDAAVSLRETDGVGFAKLQRDLRRADVRITEWNQAVNRRASERRQAARDAQRKTAIEAARAARGATADRIETARAAADEHRAAGGPLAAHYPAPLTINGVVYGMEPGRSYALELRGEDARQRELANFSAVIERYTLDYDSPDSEPTRTNVLSMVVGDGQPFRFEVPADRFEHMDWVGTTQVPTASVIGGRRERDELRVLIQRASAPKKVRRNRFIGWLRDGDEWIYVHAAGAIGANGAVEGMLAAPPKPVDRFALPPPPEGDDLARCARAVVDLLNVNPATVSVPIVAAAFRAALGPTRCTVHVAGSPGSGKSMMAALAQQFFGACMHREHLPCSWADGSTALGIQKALTRCGDAVMVIDDLQVQGDGSDARVLGMPKAIIQGHYNRSAPLKLQQTGTEREGSVSRCLILSTGEVIPAGDSLRQRIIAITLDQPITPMLDDTGNGLEQRALDGELAGAMAAFIRWLAPTMTKVRASLRRSEVEAARSWGLGATHRAASLFGALAVGLDMAFAWLAEIGALDDTEVVEHRARARTALARVAAENAEHVAAENPATRFLGHLRSALLSGACHITLFDGRAPPNPQLFGWRSTSQMSSATPPLPGSTPPAPEMGPSGRCVGFVDGDLASGNVYLNAEHAFAEVRAHALRLNDPLRLDAKNLGRAMYEKQFLADVELKKSGEIHTFTKRLRLVKGGPQIGGHLWVKLSHLYPIEEEASSAEPDRDPFDDEPPTSERATGGARVTADDDLQPVEHPFISGT